MMLFGAKIILEAVVYTSFIIILLFQSFYIFSILLIASKVKKEKIEDKKINEKISIIIPLFDSEKTIGKCLESILQNDVSLIKSIIIILDHCHDGSSAKVHLYEDKFKSLGIDFIISKLPGKAGGKVNAIKHGISFVQVKNILLIDADIILKECAVSQLLHFHLNNNNLFSSCLIYPYQQSKNDGVSNIICQDRLYRQNIIKAVKNRYGVANFPGSVGIVNIDKYKDFLFSGFLEDLTASFHILGIEEQIVIMPSILAYEFERESIKGLFFQRVRWSIGNIENLSLLKKTIISERNYIKKFLIASYPIMWYGQHYFIVFGMFIALFMSFKLIWLLPLILYFIQIVISNILARKNYTSSFFEIISHCLLFPLVISAAFIGGIMLIIKNKKLYFKNSILFKRI